MRAFRVQMPAGGCYWMVIDDELNVEPVADRFLRELRFGRDRAESTTKAYAGGVALFLRWTLRTGREWRTAAKDMGLFMTWLKYTPAGDDQVVVLGPGAQPVRGEGRINRVLVAVRSFLSFAVVNAEAPQWVLGVLYDLADSRDLPVEAQGEDRGVVLPAARPTPPARTRDGGGPRHRRGDPGAVHRVPLGAGSADRAVAGPCWPAPQ